MNMTNEEMKFVISGNGIDYYIIHDKAEANAKYGIYAELREEKTDSGIIRKLFFTEEEAKRRCIWLCENQVYPVTLPDVMSNLI